MKPRLWIHCLWRLFIMVGMVIIPQAVTTWNARAQTPGPEDGIDITVPVPVYVGAPAENPVQAASPQALFFENEEADGDPSVGGRLSLALDPNGFPHMSYYDSAESEFVYTYKDETGWHHDGFYYDPDGDGLRNRLGTHSDIAVDAYGVPHFAIYDETDGNLWYAKKEPDTGWSFEYVDTSATRSLGSYCSIAIDRRGYPHVSYYDATNEALLYKYRDPSGWVRPLETVDDGGRGMYSSIAIDSGNHPHIAYYDVYQENLRYAYETLTGVWGTQAVDTNAGVGTHVSLALDNNDNPHISYYDNLNQQLKYAVKSGGSWTRISFDSDNIQGQHNALALDTNGMPHITYRDETNDRLWYWYRTGNIEEWEHLLVDEAEQTGYFNDLALDVHDMPHVGWQTTWDGHVWYGRVAQPAPTSIQADAWCAWGSRDCNRCAYSVVDQFNNLRDHGEVMGYHLYQHPEPYFNMDPFDSDDNDHIEWHSHWQGVQRLTAGTGRYMIVTQDAIHRPVTGGYQKSSGVAVVYMGSRDANGERYRSNRLSTADDFDDTPPNEGDYVARTLYISTEETHPGGIQVLGDILAVGTGPKVNFYDLDNPTFLSADEPPIAGAVPMDRGAYSASSTSLARLRSGHYLLAVSSSNAVPLDFYISYAPDSLDDPDNSHLRFVYWDRWSPSELKLTPGIDFEHETWDAYQSLNFITECGTGDLYLVGTGNNDETATCTGTYCLEPFGWPCFDTPGPDFCLPDGEDRADLYKVNLTNGQFKLTKVAERHFYCGQHGDDPWHKHCNFDAAAGAYVDIRGHLVLYSTEHENDGPRGLDGQETVKFTEFRSVPHQSWCSNINDAWVELYAHSFDDDKGLGESLMIDYVDRSLENYYNYSKAKDFGAGISSARWCMPSGWSYRIYDKKNPCGGKLLVLYGNNSFYEIANMKRYAFNDKAECSYFAQDPPVSAGVGPNGETLIYTFKVYDAQTVAAAQAAGIAVPASAAAEQELHTILDFPAGALDTLTTVTYTPTLPTSVPDAPVVFAGRGFKLGAQNIQYFNQPVDLTIEYSPDEALLVYPETLVIMRHDPDQDMWYPAGNTCGPSQPTTRNLDAGWVKTGICETGTYALFGERRYQIMLPLALRK